MYTLICEEFIELGGIYINFLQGVLLQNHALRNWHNPDKLKVFENLDHEPLDVVRLLQTELPPEKLALITSIQPNRSRPAVSARLLWPACQWQADYY